MAGYIVKRLLQVIPVFLGTTFLIFVVVYALPGDPIAALGGGKQHLSPSVYNELRQRYNLDDPLLVQYGKYMLNLFQGNFGTDFQGHEVSAIIARNWPTSILLGTTAWAMQVVVGIPLGMLAAYYRDRGPDAALRVFAIFTYATPVFFSGLLLKLIFGIWLGWLPVSGRASIATELKIQMLPNPSGFYLIDAFRLGSPAAIGDVLVHAILPALTLGLMTAGIFLRLVRTNMIGTLGQEFVDSGRSRGVSEFRLVTKHAYRPALIPIITVIGLQIALLLGGAVLTESTFEWKGLGFQLAYYLSARDFVAVQGIVALLAVIVALSNFIVDVLAALIDPRVRY